MIYYHLNLRLPFNRFNHKSELYSAKSSLKFSYELDKAIVKRLRINQIYVENILAIFIYL